MVKNFLQDYNQAELLPVLLAPATPKTDREPVQILIIGSERGIDNVVHSLYICRFAEVGEWTRLLPAPVPGKFMRSLIRYVSLN